MSRVIHFEIGADQPERAIKFYSGVFGWNISKWDGSMDYWLVSTGDDTQPGINGAIAPRPAPNYATVNTIGIESIDDALSKVEANGGKILEPKMPIPGVGHFALCQDTEGNMFGLMQADPTLK